MSRELWAERAGLMKELGWDHWENLATTSLVRSVQNPHPRALYQSPLLYMLCLAETVRVCVNRL